MNKPVLLEGDCPIGDGVEPLDSREINIKENRSDHYTNKRKPEFNVQV